MVSTAMMSPAVADKAARGRGSVDVLEIPDSNTRGETDCELVQLRRGRFLKVRTFAYIYLGDELVTH